MADVLNYGLPPTPQPSQRWYIRKGYKQGIRYLRLERKTWLGSWVAVNDKLISPWIANDHGFQEAVRRAAKEIVGEIEVDFNYPTGEVI